MGAWIMRVRDSREARLATKFGTVGAANTAITVVVYAALVLVGADYVVAGVIGWTLGTLNGYFWNRTWTFRAGAHSHAMLVKYVTVQIGGVCLNAALLELGVGVIGLPELTGQVAVLPFVLVYSFTVNRFWTFAEADDARPAA
jgi:putative flippase GtrA